MTTGLNVDVIRESILTDASRYKVVVAGRRWGKTTLALIWLLLSQFMPAERRWYIAPTYRQGRMIAFPLLKRLFRGLDSAKINESNLSIILNNGAEISIKGADNEDSLRGTSLAKVVLDEYAYMRPNVWQEIVLPMLADTKGQAMFIGTPDGYTNGFYDIYSKGLNNDEDWRSWQFKTVEGGFVPADEIEKMRGNMDERVFRQEFEATFETASNRCAYNFNRDKHITKDYEPSKLIYFGVDYNVDYNTALLIHEYTDSTIHVSHEIRLSNSNTEELSKHMKKLATEVVVYPDPAGKARSTQSDKSDHQIMRDHGFKIRARRSHPSHRARLNALNRKLLDANGKVGVTISPNCKWLIRDLEQCTRDKYGGIDKSDITLTHALDAVSYAIEYKFPVLRREAVSVQW